MIAPLSTKLLDRRQFLFIWVMLLLICTQSASGDEDPRPLNFDSKDPAYIKVIETLQETTEKAKEIGFCASVRFDSHPLKSVFYPTLGKVKGVKSFQIASAESSLNPKAVYWWIDTSEDGTLLLKYDFAPPDQPQPIPFTAAFSETESSNRCQNFIDLLLESTDIKLQKGEIKFVQHVNYGNKEGPYIGAYWRASYQRVSNKGIPILGDSLSICIDEKYGLRNFYNDSLTVLDIPQNEEPQFSKDAATRAAIILAQQVKIEGPAVKSYYGLHQLETIPLATDLMIACPTDILTCSDFHVLKRDKKAVLVWVVKFRLSDPSGKRAPGMLLIYIDAITGKFAGGIC